MSKHTKGKWEVEICGEALATYIVTKDNENIAQLSWTVFGADREEIDANARLIASAPELLEACKRFIKNSACQNGCKENDMTCDTQFAKQAIAKAEAI